MKQLKKQEILDLFFDSPTKRFQLREVSRGVNLSPSSVKPFLEILIKRNIIVRQRAGIYPYFISNQESREYKFEKRINIIERIHSSLVIDFLEDKMLPNSIFMFGSCSRGEDDESSDLDLFVESEDVDLNLKKFERKVGRKISIYFSSDFKGLNDELKNNIVNGIRLSGYLQVF